MHDAHPRYHAAYELWCCTYQLAREKQIATAHQPSSELPPSVAYPMAQALIQFLTSGSFFDLESAPLEAEAEAESWL
jgi:hypothetical protein